MEDTRIIDAVGHTPVVKIALCGPQCATVLAKLEYLNPGSIKDRMVRFIVDKAEEQGWLKSGCVIVEATTGNTGIALAMLGASRGYKVIAVMPYGLSQERQQVMEALGAEVRVTPPGGTPADAIRMRDELARELPCVWVPDQFGNELNIQAHEETTGQEIIEQTGGQVDAFVAGVGTGGTLLGVARALRKVNPGVRIVAVEPAESAVLGGGDPGAHGIEGIGEGFIPPLVDPSAIDQVVAVTTAEARAMCRRLAKEEGILAGTSSGANVVAALRVAEELGQGRTVITILPDRGERYLSAGLFE
jgi:cysteine synthase A